MTYEVKELLAAIDEYNDSYEDIYNKTLHELTEDDGDFTVRQLLENILEKQKGN